MMRMKMPNLSDDIEATHDHNCECDECVKQVFDGKFEDLDCGGCGWCTDCFQLARQYWDS
jgi:hypothetical protein